MKTPTQPTPASPGHTPDYFAAEVANTRRCWALVANEFDAATDRTSDCADSSDYADTWAANCLVGADVGQVVRACWSHAALLAALEDAEIALSRFAGRIGTDAAFEPAFRARAAIAQAKGVKS